MPNLKKISLIIAGALILAGCSAVDDAINDAVNDTLSGDVTAETIKAKDKVLVINDVSLTACVVIKNGLEHDDDFNNAVTLITELGVTCATYGKITGDTECVEQSLAEWLEEEGHEEITDIESAQGDKACVIGADI